MIRIASMSDVRRYTNHLYYLMDEGVVSESSVILGCLKYMSELDVQGMMEANEFIRPDELDEEDDVEDVEDIEDEELPCYRNLETSGSDMEKHWVCVNDHTGCLYNDGQNECVHDGHSSHPLKHEPVHEYKA
jgi:hypothetical protein